MVEFAQETWTNIMRNFFIKGKLGIILKMLAWPRININLK